MSMTMEEAITHVKLRSDSAARMKSLLVDRLALPVDPTMIADDQPLFGRGLELDSIDTLELAMAVEEEFGVVITDDDTDTLLSLNRLVDHVLARQP